MDFERTPRHGIPQTALAGPDLHPWQRGTAVAELQELLNAHGFNLRVDGDFNYVTEAAVRDFQRQQELRIDGVAGPKTWAALKSTLQSGSRPLHQGDSGADVWELQGLLQVCGYAVTRNGVFDRETLEAILAFQEKHKLKQDGVVDAIAWRVLRGKPLPKLPNSRKTIWFSNLRRWW
jgi:peptidoglycan hydrolase-like protein with peptidoglycan-binding domain